MNHFTLLIEYVYKTWKSLRRVNFPVVSCIDLGPTCGPVDSMITTKAHLFSKVQIHVKIYDLIVPTDVKGQ